MEVLVCGTRIRSLAQRLDAKGYITALPSWMDFRSGSTPIMLFSKATYKRPYTVQFLRQLQNSS